MRIFGRGYCRRHFALWSEYGYAERHNVLADALQKLVNAPRIFLPTVLKDSVKIDKEITV